MPGSQSYRWVILALAFQSQFAATLAASAVPPLAPLLQSELGLTKAEIGVFSSAALAGSWCVLLVGGYWTERFGVRRTMSLGLLVAGSVMLTMALAGSFLQAVVVMFAVGLSRGVVQPGASKAIMDWFPAQERATAMGVKQSGYPIGAIMLGIALPALALAVGWRFAIALVGVLLLCGGIITATFYRSPSGQRPVSSGKDLQQALRQLLLNRLLWILSLVALLLLVAQQGLTTYLALYFTEVVLVGYVPDLNARIIAAGVFLAIMQAGGVVGRIFWGLVSDRLLRGSRMPALALVGTIGAGMALLFAFFAPSLPIPGMVLLVFIYGATANGWNGLYQALAVETAGRKHAAMGVGLVMTITQFGTVGGPPLFGLIVDVSGTYQAAWVCMALFSLAGGAVAALCTRNESREKEAGSVLHRSVPEVP